jgi:hypothetical protein
VDPVGTTYNSLPIQPEDDHTAAPGALCFVTGQHVAGESAGYNDVDGGKTTLLTPVFHLDGAQSAAISYWRWYTNAHGNNAGDDYWNVDVTSDGVTWVSLEHTMEDANSWNFFTFDLQEYIALTDQVQIRFVASDTELNSLVEAAVDDFLLSVFNPPPTAIPDGQAAGAASGILSVSPNPFNPKATIVYRLSERQRVSLCIYDLQGRLARTLLDGEVGAGDHRIVFDGANDGGYPMASGIYFLRMESPAVTQVRKITLLK